MNNNAKNALFIFFNIFGVTLEIMMAFVFLEYYFVGSYIVTIFIMPILLISLNVLNCIFLKNWIVVFVCTIVHTIIPLLLVVIFFQLSNYASDNELIFVYLVLLLFVSWCFAATAYKRKKYGNGKNE